MAEQSTNYTITMVVHDVPGTMLRVAQVFARRGVNIDSIHVTHKTDGPWSEMVVGVRGVERIDQITRQLEKLVDVHTITVKKS